MIRKLALLESKLIDVLLVCVASVIFFSCDYARSDGGKGAITTVLEASNGGCPGLPPIDSPDKRLYVAPTGNDASSGSLNDPFATLRKATSLLPNGGTVILRGGDYPVQPIFDAAGLKNKPLHIRAADGEKPVFDGSSIQEANSAVIYMASASHVVIEGLEVRNCFVFGCMGIASDAPVVDLTIRGTHIHHVASSAARFSGRQIRIEDNNFHDVALVNKNNTNFPDGGWPTCVGTMPNIHSRSNPWANDVVIRANRVRDCWGEGIGVWYGSNVVVEDNSIVNAWNAGIYADNSYNVRIARNYVRIDRGLGGGAGTGILLGLEDYNVWGLPNVATKHVLVTNNVVIAGVGIGWWAVPTPDSTYESVHVFHNSVAGTHEEAINIATVLPGVEAPSNSFIANNVFFGVTESKLGNPGAFMLGGNAWINRPIPAIAGIGDVSLEVELTDELLQQARVNEAQPLVSFVGAGDSRVGLTEDFLCDERDTFVPTRGAFER